MVAMGGIGNILMLSSASAPSRVPHVVCWPAVSYVEGNAMVRESRHTSVTVMQPESLMRLWK